MRRRRLILALAALGLLGQAWAQAPGRPEWGQIHAFSHHAFPDAAALLPRLLDDHPEHARLLPIMASALRQSGRVVGDGQAPLQLSLETEVALVPTTLHRGVADTRGRVKFVVALTVDERESGRRLWSGEISYLAPENDGPSILDQIVRLLVPEIGRAVRPRGFTLD